MILIDLKKYRNLLFLFLTAIVIIFASNSSKWVAKLLYPFYYQELIFQYANNYDIDPYLIAAIIRTESKFYEKAQSRKNARGLMQIAPITGEWASKELAFAEYDEEMLFIPELNIMIGCWYLDRLRLEFKNNLPLMLAAYNGGSGNVRKWLKDPRYSEDGQTLRDIPFNETKAYVDKVLNSYKIYNIIYR
ncbi:MAG: lytic transglycosylase domain-containing protein [Thermotaleaceae bacterium]